MLFQLFLSKVGELVLSKVGESFWSKVVDKTTDEALDEFNNIKNFELILKTLQESMKLLSIRASDIEAEITNAESSHRKQRKREVEEWLKQVKSFEKEVEELTRHGQEELPVFFKGLMNGGKAQQLNDEIVKLVEQSKHFGRLVHHVPKTSAGDSFLTNGLVGKAFEENLETILRLLESREVSSIGVYGMGGVGKTTLSQHIYNRLQQQCEGSVLWITVSQSFTMRGLQDKVARFLKVDLSYVDEVGMRAMRLSRALSEKGNSVLILDDVWEHIDMWKLGCSSSVECCRVIVTTRSLDVCRGIGCEKEIPVNILHEGEAWKLFKERLGSGSGIELDPKVEGIAKSMVKLCSGLPLGIITVAGSMKGQRSSDRWEYALVELQERVKGQDGMDEDEVFKVLKFSFNRLNKGNGESNELNTIQRCFVYCSLYPEDHEISIRGLVRKFISEGLLSERKSRRARVVQGNSIVDELVNVCLLESCVNYGRACVKMHDLVRSMALKICGGKYMVIEGEKSWKEIPNQEEWTKDLEKVSFILPDIGSIKEGLSPDCPKLSTLLLSENDSLEFIPESFFSKMQGLCTLDLSNTRIWMLPDSISDLTSLKALLLEGCEKLENVPYLGKLKALRELDLSYTCIEEVPQGVEELLKLEFLSLKNAYGLKNIPSELLVKLVHLRNVKFPFHIKAPIEGIKNLKLLEKFCGRVGCVEEFNYFIRSRDIWYTITVAGDVIEGAVISTEMAFRSTTHKKKLGVVGCKLEDERVLGRDVESVVIDGCEGLSISFLDDFSRLKALRIQNCGGIEWILRSDGHGSQFSNTVELIDLQFLDDLKGVVMERGEIGPSTTWQPQPQPQPPVFSALRKLVIHRCDKMRKIGLPISGFPNLEVIRVRSCGEIEEIFEEDERRAASILTTPIFPKLKELNVSDLPRLRKVGLPLSRVPNLEEIDIRSCKEIEEIFEEDEGRVASIITTLPRLKELKLQRLPRLRKVGLSIQEYPNLKIISIWGCGEIEEIFEEDEGIGASILTTLALPKLRELFLENLPRLKSVSKATIMSNSIETIRITKCPRLMNKMPVHFGDPTPPPSLRGISVEREWWESLDPSLPRLLLPLVTFKD